MTLAAGKSFKIAVSSTINGTYYNLRAESGDCNFTADSIDTTDTSNAGYHTRLINLLDTAVNFEGKWLATDQALDVVRTVFSSGGTLYVKFLPDGQAGNGHKIPVVITSLSIKLGTSDVAKVSASFEGNGPVTADDE